MKVFDDKPGIETLEHPSLRVGIALWKGKRQVLGLEAGALATQGSDDIVHLHQILCPESARIVVHGLCKGWRSSTTIYAHHEIYYLQSCLPSCLTLNGFRLLSRFQLPSNHNKTITVATASIQRLAFQDETIKKSSAESLLRNCLV